MISQIFYGSILKANQREPVFLLDFQLFHCRCLSYKGSRVRSWSESFKGRDRGWEPQKCMLWIKKTDKLRLSGLRPKLWYALNQPQIWRIYDYRLLAKRTNIRILGIYKDTVWIPQELSNLSNGKDVTHSMSIKQFHNWGNLHGCTA